MIGNVEISSSKKCYRIVGNLGWKHYDNLNELKKELINERHKDLMEWMNSSSLVKKSTVDRLEWTDVVFYEEDCFIL